MFRDVTMDKSNYTSSFSYSECFVCFLDILGFKNLIYESVHDKSAFDKVQLISQLVYTAQQQYLSSHWNSYFKFPITTQGLTCDKLMREEDLIVEMSLFSDSIIVSYVLEKEGRFVDWYRQMYQILNDICRLQFEFARNSIFFRGGMSYGKLFHNRNICFGPALIDAVALEKRAINPCIAVDNRIIDKIKMDMNSDEIDDYMPGYKYPHEIKTFARDLYITHFSRIDMDSNNRTFNIDPNNRTFMLDWLASQFFSDSRNIAVIKPVIEAELQKDYLPKVKEKYEWLKRYYNYTISLAGNHADMRIL